MRATILLVFLFIILSSCAGTPSCKEQAAVWAKEKHIHKKDLSHQMVNKMNDSQRKIWLSLTGRMINVSKDEIEKRCNGVKTNHMVPINTDNIGR